MLIVIVFWYQDHSDLNTDSQGQPRTRSLQGKLNERPQMSETPQGEWGITGAKDAYRESLTVQDAAEDEYRQNWKFSFGFRLFGSWLL